jgi:hypothetical protein
MCMDPEYIDSDDCLYSQNDILSASDFLVCVRPKDSTSTESGCMYSLDLGVRNKKNESPK